MINLMKTEADLDLNCVQKLMKKKHDEKDK